jgi:plastocyanin
MQMEKKAKNATRQAGRSKQQNKTTKIKIKIDRVGDGYNFTYIPSTVYVSGGDELKFVLDKAAVPNGVWVVFDEPIFGKRTRNWERIDKPKAAANSNSLTPFMVSTDATRGPHHYQVIGYKGRRLIADVWCPSIIVH